jgi:protein TonB
VLKSSGHAVLDQAAEAAVRGWRFQPATRGGVPVAAPADVPFRFRLQD